MPYLQCSILPYTMTHQLMAAASTIHPLHHWLRYLVQQSTPRPPLHGTLLPPCLTLPHPPLHGTLLLLYHTHHYTAHCSHPTTPTTTGHTAPTLPYSITPTTTRHTAPTLPYSTPPTTTRHTAPTLPYSTTPTTRHTAPTLPYPPLHGTLLPPCLTLPHPPLLPPCLTLPHPPLHGTLPYSTTIPVTICSYRLGRKGLTTPVRGEPLLCCDGCCWC